MLFGSLTIAALIANALALLLAIDVHEFSHVLMAYQLGDSTGKRQGRLSLNPLVHLDPLGTLMLLIARFGWGKPAPVNPYNLRNGPQAGMAMVAAAGPLSNLFTAALLAIPLRLELVPALAGGRIFPSLYELLTVAILINVILAVFNFLPIAPLDGFRVLAWFLPSRYSANLAQLEYYGPVILLFLISLGFFGFNFLGLILGGPVRFLLTLILGQPLI